MQKEIAHEGRIKQIKNNKVVVDIACVSACAGCHARGACSAADTDNKEIEVSSFNQNFEIGEKVKITGKESQGLKAVFLGYMLPFIIVLTMLIVLLSITNDEAISGIGSLASLIPYYLIIYNLRNRLSKTFVFKLEKLP